MYPTETEQMTIFEFYPQGTLDLVSLLVSPGSEKARKTTATSGQKLSAYLKRSDPVGLLAKMLLDTSHWGSMKCFLTWQASTTPRNRLLFQLAVSEQITDERGYSLLPTPTASLWKGTSKKRYKGSKHYKASHTQEALRNGQDDPTHLNPSYCEVLMGFPTGWLDLNHSETQLFLDKSIPS